MADEQQPPRRWKLPSEIDDDERQAATLARESSQIERPEYLAWRKAVLENERDDLALRNRLLREEAECLRRRARVRRIGALDALTPEDHAAHLDAIRSLHEEKRAPLRPGEWPDLPDAGAAALESRADQLEVEAAEIETYGDHLLGEPA